MKILVVKGLEFTFDDEDFDKVKDIRWSLNNKGYPLRTITTKVGRVSFLLYWAVIGVPPIGLTVDHIDHNPRNNQRNNLRFATKQQQRFNSKARAKSGYKGVGRCPDSKANPWVATIHKDDKNIYIGAFPTAEAASDAYFEAAKKLFGEYASK